MNFIPVIMYLYQIRLSIVHGRSTDQMEKRHSSEIQCRTGVTNHRPLSQIRVQVTTQACSSACKNVAPIFEVICYWTEL